MSKEIVKTEKLKGKQKSFADHYLTSARFNGTKAAELAEYGGSRVVLASVAYENLRKPHIKAYIDERLSAMTMPSNVVLTRLTEIAESDTADVCDENGNFSFKLAKEKQKTHLLKKIKVKRTLKQKKTAVADSMRDFLAEDEINDLETETEILYEEIDFEMYSMHEALRDLGKVHKLFVDKIEQESTVTHSLDATTIKEINKAYDEQSLSDKD